MGHRPSHTDISSDLVKEKIWEGGGSGSLMVGGRWGVRGERRGRPMEGRGAPAWSQGFGEHAFDLGPRLLGTSCRQRMGLLQLGLLPVCSQGVCTCGSLGLNPGSIFY